MVVIIHVLFIIDWAFLYWVTHLPMPFVVDGCTNDGPSPPSAQLLWSCLPSHQVCRVIVSILFGRVLECVL